MAVKKKYAGGTRRALGKGLDALISTEVVRTEGSTTINEIPLSQIEPNPAQPRREFAENTLAELAESIREIGIIQPITIHQTSSEKYIIIAGERRWRAAQMAGLNTIPAYIRTLNDASMMEMALIENIQREDLNAIEVALAYQQLMEREGMTQEKISQRVGKSRTVITNTLRLLRLPAEVQMALQKGDIDMGHARALLAIESPTKQVSVFRETIKKGYSVRQVEELAQQVKRGEEGKGGRASGTMKTLPAKYNDAKKKMAKLFGAKVEIVCAKTGRGKITIAFDSEEAFDSLMGKLSKIKK